MKFFGSCDIHSKFGELWGMFRHWKMIWDEKVFIEKTIGPLQVETCLGPKNGQEASHTKITSEQLLRMPSSASTTTGPVAHFLCVAMTTPSEIQMTSVVIRSVCVCVCVCVYVRERERVCMCVREIEKSVLPAFLQHRHKCSAKGCN